MLPTENLVIHPAIVLKVNNVSRRDLFDTGAGSSYASARY